MITASSNLKEYKTKRNFHRTNEPEGAKGNGGLQSRFVIQKHDASSLHYDFRIEVEGVFKSWAIPKGPSTDPRVKRLAVPTEDHPLEYGAFEGIIPEGEYGAGVVLIWDQGTYENLTRDDTGKTLSMAKCLDDGHVAIRLDGVKISGGYSLIRTGSGEDVRWLLIKHDDDKADARRNPVSTEPLSVVSGRDLREIAEEPSAG